MATQVGTEKIMTSQTISATADEATSERFEVKRACRVINETASSVTFTIYQENSITRSMVLCEDIPETTISAGASVDLGALVFACDRIALKLNAGAAELTVIAAE